MEIIGAFDAHVAEAFRLELRRLVERHGAKITEFRVGVASARPRA